MVKGSIDAVWFIGSLLNPDMSQKPLSSAQPVSEESLLPARVLAMCQKRGWDLHWTCRGAYLHLEASELIEALRGKRGDPLAEAADVLLVLMSITENAGISWADVLTQTAMTCARLETCAPYLGEERSATLDELAAQAQELGMGYGSESSLNEFGPDDMPLG